MTDTEKSALCARIDELCAENAKLREQGERLFDKTLELGTENVRLREFVAGMWRLFVEHCDMDASHLAEVDAVRDSLCELGIEVTA